MKLDVSRQVPNVPFATFSSTPSVETPAQAYSQSWIVPAPLVARWVSQFPAIIRSRMPAAPLRGDERHR